MLDPPTHNRPFADKRDKAGMDGVPKILDCFNVDFHDFILLLSGRRFPFDDGSKLAWY